MTIEIRRIANWSQAASYQEAWNNLILKQTKDQALDKVSSLPTIFQTFEWNQNWWQTFADDSHELLLLFAFDKESLVGIAPLMIKTLDYPLPTRVIYWIGASDTHYSSDFCSFIIACDYDKVMNALFEWIESQVQEWDEMEFRQVSEGSNDFAYLKRRLQPSLMLQYMHDAPSRCLKEQEDSAEFFGKNTKTKLNKLKREGTVSFVCLDNAKDIHLRLEEFFEQHIERRSKTPFPSYFSNTQFRNFYRLLVDTMAGKGWLGLYTVMLNDKIIASYFIFKFKGILYLYTPTFDFRLERYSPGELLNRSIIKYALEHNMQEVNFGAGSEAYKYRYSNQAINLYKFRAFKSKTRYIVFKIEFVCRGIARQLLKPIRHVLRKRSIS